ncbi:MAG: alanine dehydrogenase [Actinomycetota bacterium]
MRVGIPSEVKVHEYRVAITPAGVHELVRNGHEVFIQSQAGIGSAISDDEFVSAGAKILPTATDIWETSEMILKVKEPIASEYELMREGQLLFTYLHLAASKPCTDALLSRKVTAIAYETVRGKDGSLPLLAPMSEVAGRLAAQVGADSLLKAKGGRGVLLAGIPGVAAGNVVVIGGGVAGMSAARIAIGLGAHVTIFDLSPDRLRMLDNHFGASVQTLMANEFEVARAVAEADLVIGAVLVPGAKAPKVVTNEMVANMKPGSVLVDISIDQGGCFEDSKPTTHAEPTFLVHNSIFYCVANMPGAVPRTSTYGLTNATLPYAVKLANSGWRTAVESDPGLLAGLHTHDGLMFNKPVADTFGLPLAVL